MEKIRFIVEPESEAWINGLITGLNAGLLDDDWRRVSYRETRDKRKNASFIHFIGEITGEESRLLLIQNIFAEDGIMPADTSEI